MKIAFVGNAESIHIVRWANAFALRGHDVAVITCKNHFGGNAELYDKSVKIISLKFPSPLGYYLNAPQLKRITKKEKFDIVNVHYASGYGTLGRLAGLKNALLNIWGSDVYEFPYESKSKYKILKKNLSYYSRVASTSNCMASQAKRIAERDYYITPFGVDTDLFKPMPELKPKDEIIFGTVKTLSPKYGIADTINAFTKLYNRLLSEGKTEIAKKLHYEIYGTGELKDDLQKLIESNEMSDKIKLCGYVPNNELPKIYNRFVISNSNSNSNSESFGVAAVEAMACGIPVQVSDADGFCEVVDDGVTGLIAPKGDADKISENMYTLLMDENLRNSFGIAARKRAVRLYDWNSNVDVMEEIFMEIGKECR